MGIRITAEPSIEIFEQSNAGYAMRATWDGSGATPPTTASVFGVGCVLTNALTGVMYRNTGTVASPSWDTFTEIGTTEIAAGAVTLAKLKVDSEARTATADGLTTGAITATTGLLTFITVTSDSATKFITLPAITAAGIGQVLYLTVGANGYELVTPASSNNTINQVDSDQTNQLDVAANTTVRLTQITATGWLAETIAAATIAITAPDND